MAPSAAAQVAPLDRSLFDAVLFDMDGVLTTTARLHAAAWKHTFDELIPRWDAEHGTKTQPFQLPEDYTRHVDGKPRYDGVRDFLASRGIELPEGTPGSPPSELSVCGVGNRKQLLVERALREEGVEAFPGSVAWLRELRDEGFRTAVVSSSRNCAQVLDVAGIWSYFDVIVDGSVIEDRGLAGKPAPDSYVEAAQRLGVPPARAVVVEDALAGVEAGRAGGFGLVIGVDRGDQADALHEHGADVVVADLAECVTPTKLAYHGPREHRLVAAAARLMAAEGAYPVEPFRLVEREYSPATVPQTETLFALANGFLGVRGSFEEGGPASQPGTLLNGFHETWPIEYAEGAFGFATVGQTIVNVPDATAVRLYVDDEPFRCDRAELLSFERDLDMRAGTLDRTVRFRAADGRRFQVRSTRMVSLVHRHLALVVYEVTSLDGRASLTIASELERDHAVHGTDGADPRGGRGFERSVLEPVADRGRGTRGLLCLRTSASGLLLGCGMENHVEGDAPVSTALEHGPGFARLTARVDLERGQKVLLVKYVAYHYERNADADADELLYRVGNTLDRARDEGVLTLLEAQRDRLTQFWADADVRTEGTPLLQQAVRFNVYELLQASARVEGFGIPAKGLTGRGYEGHYFWDTEIYVMPFLTYTMPAVARNLLVHRYEMLDAARRRAAQVSQRGALFPWRTINGEEASAYYAAGTAQYHIDADVAYALDQYVWATGDHEFLARYGAEILVETARMWADLGHFSERQGGRFVINGVTGPDEYSTVVDNNLYTNLMAQENLRAALRAVEWLRGADPNAYRRLVDAVHLEDHELDLFARAADHMAVPYDSGLGVHLQDDDFMHREPWDFAGTPKEKYPLLLHFHPLVIYRHQVIKQADVVLAAFLLGDRFTDDQKRRIFEYYDPLTTGDSSLSECIQSIVAAEVGDLRAAEEYLVDAASVDLADRAGNLRDGVHVASAGGTWMALVFGFAGMRDRNHVLAFRPVLPVRMTRFRFRVKWRGRHLEVEVGQDDVRYRLLSGEAMVLRHVDELIAVPPGETVRASGPGRPGPIQ